MSFGQVSPNHKMQIIRERKESWRGSQASPRAQMQDVATWLASDGHEWRELECLTESQGRGERKVWDKPAWPRSSQGGLCSVNDRRHCLVILFVTVSLCHFSGFLYVLWNTKQFSPLVSHNWLMFNPPLHGQPLPNYLPSVLSQVQRCLCTRTGTFSPHGNTV